MQAFTKEEVDTFIAEWTAALRSGHYLQTEGKLKDSGGQGFCCLGVACDLLASKVGGEWDAERSEKSDRVAFVTKDDVNDEGLPGDISRALGMSSPGYFKESDGCLRKLVYDGGEYESLADLNDQEIPFTEIAGIIEQNKHLLFNVYRSA